MKIIESQLRKLVREQVETYDFFPYPYGEPKGSKVYQQAVSWLLKNKEAIDKSEYFDYPDYWGMPKEISYQLSSDEVDAIQAVVYDWAPKAKY